MEKFTKKSIENTLKILDIPVDHFFKTLNAEEDKVKELKKQKKLEEKLKREIDSEYIFESVPEGKTLEEFFEGVINKGYWNDWFYDGDGLPDEGVDMIFYFKVGEKIYEVELHCEAEWVSDWSVRKNLPGEVSLKNIKEIEKYEILEQTDYNLTFKIIPDQV